MKVYVTFSQINPEYNEDYANQFHMGKESDGNSKYLWSKGFKLYKEIKTHAIIENTEFNLTGTYNNDQAFSFVIPGIKKLECRTTDDELITIVISNNLINNYHVAENEKYNWTRYYFYLHGTKGFINPTELIYISDLDFPYQLLI